MQKVSLYFPWRRDFELNIKDMDRQHRELVSLINSLQGAINEGLGREIVAEILENLLEYTDYHFAAEEKLMKKHNYPGLDTHIKKHRAMRAKVLSLIGDYNSGRTAMTFSLLKFLQDWLSKHIMGTDKKYADYLVSKGVK